MKSIRGILLCGAVLAASFYFVHAQSTDSSPQFSADDTSAMLGVIEQATPTSFSSLPRGGMGGMFYSAQHAPGTRGAWPPLPGDIYGLDAWNLGDGVWLLNDTNFDYDAFGAEWAAEHATATPMVRMSMMASSLSIAYAYSNPVYLTNMVANFAYDGSITANFSIAGGTNFMPYDILETTNLLNPVADWNWLGVGYTSNNYTFYEQPPALGFFILAKPSKTMTVGFGNDAVGQCDVPYGITNAVQVAGGGGQSLALLNNGTVMAWGANYYGEGVVPTNLNGVAMVSAGWYHNVALLTNGTVTAWGISDSPLFGGLPVTNVPPNLTNVILISAQALHSLALESNGTVVAWGYGEDGETNVPAGLTNVTAISAGYQFNLAVSNGAVVAWGDNTYGQCSVPAGLSNVVDVEAGVYHSLALLNNGTVAAWGDNDEGEIDVPSGLTNVVAIAASGDPGIDTAYSMALKSDGTVVVWGDDDAVDPVAGLSNVVMIAAGADDALAIRTGQRTPVITLEPTDEYQVQDGNATFTARGAGLYGVTYQWQTNGVNLAGATNASLTLTNVQAAQLGSYDAVVTDNGGMGSIASSNVNFYFVTPPVILSQTLPTNQVITYQSNLVLQVVATAPGIYNGFPLSYQWQFEGTNIAGATGANYTNRVNGSSSGTYSVLISNAAGSTNTAWLVTVYYEGIVISQQPTNQYQIAGGNVTFAGSAVASNSVTYQWAFDGTNIAGATNASLTLTNVQSAQQGDYNLTASDGIGSVTSSNAYFILVTPPAVVSQTLPLNLELPPQTYSTLSVTASAPGQTNGFPLHYQWQFNGVNLSGQTATNYLFYVYESGTYSVVITNAAGSTNVSWQVNVLYPGAIACWGDNEDGESIAPLGVTNILSIAAGEYHSVAVEDNGSVIQWGYNWGNVPADLTNAVAVSAGYEHTIALRNNGTVETWGNGYADYVPTNLTGVQAVAAGWDDNVALLTNGTVTAWGLDGDYFGWGDMTAVPAGLTNVTAIAAESLHALALTGNGTVAAWGDDREGESDVPAGLSNVVAVAAGGQHSLALLTNGTVVAWGLNDACQCSVPAGLSNVLAIAAGWEHSVALLNNGTVVSWGDNSDGQTNTPTLKNIKFIAAGGDHTIADIFSPLVMYPVDVTKDLLLIYNTNSADSATVLNYYLAHRPLVSGANVLGVGFAGFYVSNAPSSDVAADGFTGLTNVKDYECISPTDFTNQILNSVQNWLAQNPTKRPQYIIMFLDVPSRINGSATTAANAPFYVDSGNAPSVSYELATSITGWQPFITHINMNGTNDCIGYINKLAYIGTNYSPRKLIISASASGYGNTNYYIDDGNNQNYGVFGISAVSGILNENPTATVIYSNNVDNGVASHIITGVNVAGYFCWGAHSTLGSNYPLGYVNWTGNNAWWIIETAESFNGQRYESHQCNYIKWFSPNAFGGTNYSNTPNGAVSNTDEPNESGLNNPSVYFGLWAYGKNFAICAWVSRNTPYFQAVGDPLIVQ